MSKHIVIVRGIPGSGKSTLVNNLCNFLVDESIDHAVVELDNFFTKNGEYKFVSSLFLDAHAYMWEECLKFAKKSMPIIIIDDVNLKYRHAIPFFLIAQMYGYSILKVEPQPLKRFDVDISHERNVHDVPKETIHTMSEMYEETLEWVKSEILFWVKKEEV